MITSPKKVMFSVWSVSLKQDRAKHADPISIQFGGREEHGPRRNPISFGTDPSLGADLGLYHLFL